MAYKTDRRSNSSVRQHPVSQPDLEYYMRLLAENESPAPANLQPNFNSSNPYGSLNAALAAASEMGLTATGDSPGGPSGPNLIAPVPPDIPKPEAEAAIERRLNRGKKETAAPFDDGNLSAINALMELAGSAPQPGETGGIDIASIMKEAAGAARAPFQAQIQSTKNQNQRAKADTDYSSKQIRKMYRALAKSNRRSAVRESNQAEQSAQTMQDMSQQSAEQLEAQNQERLNAAATQANALGSGDLAATLSANINANTSEGARQLAETANTAATATLNRGEAERRYLNRNAGNMKLTGTNRAADLYGDLQDYLQGNRDQINELRGQATAAAGQARSAAQTSAASATSDLYDQQYRAHQDMLQNQMALLGMKTDLQQQDFTNNISVQELMMQLAEQNQAEQPLVPGFDDRAIQALPPEQRSALILQQYLTPGSGNSLEKLMQNPALRSGFYEDETGNKIPISGNPLNSEQLMAQLGLSSGDPRQNFLLSQIIAQLASANTDLPYGAQR